MTFIANAATDSEEHEEIEITPEMIEAGIKEYALFDFYDPGEWVVCAIYRAMAVKRADHLKSPALGLPAA
jgi:hypothetical protein